MALNVDMSQWSNADDPESAKTRSQIVLSIIENQHIADLKAIMKGGWNPNEILTIPSYQVLDCSAGETHSTYKKRTPLQEATGKNWKEGVKTLLDAGAECNLSAMSPEDDQPFEVLLSKGVENVMVKVILGISMDCKSDKASVLMSAIKGSLERDGDTQITKLLLENGAELNDKDDDPILTVLEHLAKKLEKILLSKNHKDWSAAIRKANLSNFVTFELIIKRETDMNRIVHKGKNLLQTIIYPWTTVTYVYYDLFLPEHLDLFYQLGGDIHLVGGHRGSTLQYAVSGVSNSNSIRWLIRHGADTTSIRTLDLVEHFFWTDDGSHTLAILNQTPLVLHQCGVAFPFILKSLLLDIREAIRESLLTGRDLCNQFKKIWDKYIFLVHKDMLLNPRRASFRGKAIPVDVANQSLALMSFSDQSLGNYTNDDTIFSTCYIKGSELLAACEHIRTIIGVLFNVSSLQWHCRRSIRDSLVSLTPSFVNDLPVPSRLKCYILCHEV